MTERFLDRVQIRKIKLTFTSPILGMAPLSKSLYTDYIASKAPTDSNTEDEVDMIVNGEKGKTGFHSDDDGIYLLSHQIMGFIKSAANNEKEIVGIKNLKSKIEDFLFVKPRHIWLKEKPDGVIERPLKAQTPKGPRISLACSDYVDDVAVTFELHLLPHKEITWEVVEQLFDYGQYQGISQWRNASYGQFTYEWIGDKK
jgi:hypothetical protein